MLYDVTIAGVTEAAPSDGFIDYKTVYVYGNAYPEDLPSTYDDSLAKARAYNRHKAVTGLVAHYGNIEIVGVSTTGSPDADTAPASIIYRIDCVLDHVNTEDEENPGESLTGNDAIKRIFARALVRERTLALEVLDPTKATAKGNETAFARAGARTNIETVGALYDSLSAAEGGITITAV